MICEHHLAIGLRRLVGIAKVNGVFALTTNLEFAFGGQQTGQRMLKLLIIIEVFVS